MIVSRDTRYGLGLSSLSTFISLSIPHIASERPSKHSLAAEFLSGFSNVCYCVRIAKGKPANEWNRVVSLEDSKVLVDAQDWLATTARQTIKHSKDLSSLSDEPDMRIAAARLCYLQSYFAAFELGSFQVSEQRKHGEDNIDWPDVVVALKHLSENKVLECALAMVPAHSFDQSTLDASDGWIDIVSAQEEATACAFIDALSSLLYTMSISECRQLAEGQAKVVLTAILSKFKAIFMKWMNEPTTASITIDSHPKFERARRGWLNATNFHVSIFALTHLHISDSCADTTELELIRSHAFSLIGRLQLGEEAFASMLFSIDGLFRTNDESRSIDASPLSSFFMQELCATSLARQQLDHSFKLHYGCGITANEWGPFEIRTLLSECDAQEPRSSAPFSELLLPIGSLWLWKVLSGATMHEVENVGNSEDEMDIRSASLELLLLLEDQKVSTAYSYASQVPDGAKLYYLMNIFLQSESVLRNDRINELVAALFDRYTEKIRNKEQSKKAALGHSFWQACLDHSQLSRSNEPNEMNAKDEQLFSMLMGQNFTKMRPLIDFVADIANAYLEFGAQYESFTKCIRLFLSVGFPLHIRCEAIRSLREVLHLLTLSQEENHPDGQEMIGALNMCLFGDVIGSDEAVRDSSELLDLILSVLKEDASGQGRVPRWSASSGGFFFLFAVASFARTLAVSIKDGVTEKATKNRLASLSKKTRDIVLETASRLQSDSDEKIKDVVSAVIEAVMDYR